MSLRAPSRQIARLASATLKIAGVIITLVALLDMFILPLPYVWLNRQWQVAFATQVVDRGLVPLVGLALFFAGFWVDTLSGVPVGKRKGFADLKFWALLISGILGIFYLLLFPFHLNNVVAVNKQSLEQIEQDTNQAKLQLDSRLNQEVGQQRQQLEQLLANEELLNQALQSGQISQEQASLIQQFRQNPDSLDQFIAQRTDELQSQLQNRIGSERQQAIGNARVDALKSGLRVGVSSLLFAIGYTFICWTGLKAIGEVSPKRSSFDG